MNNGFSNIPIGRIIDKLDTLLCKKDFSGAEKHLKYWYSEALAANNINARLTLLNELIGFYRKQNRKDECLNTAAEALEICRSHASEDSLIFATTYLNSATGYKAFGMPDEAISLYKQALTVYTRVLEPADGRMGGLYNNMALAYADINDFDNAENYYKKAIDVMSQNTGGEPETAITYLNLADLYLKKLGFLDGDAIITECLHTAEKLLDTEGLNEDGNFAYICEKCAPVFGFYGYFLTEQKLNERAKRIYERITAIT